MVDVDAMRVQAVSMSTHQPPDLAAIRARCEAAEAGPWPNNPYAVLLGTDAQQDVRALLDLIDKLRTTIELFGDYNVISAAKAEGLLG